MVAMVLDEALQRQLVSARRAAGTDRYDEVWEGVYIMSPSPDPQHQGLGGKVYIVLDEVIDSDGLGSAHFGVNVTDRFEGWAGNYRVPDLAVYLEDNPVENAGAAFVGGPDFIVEIRSDEDRTWEKLPFYASIGVRELLVIERDPWKLTLLRLAGSELTKADESTVDGLETIHSQTIPLAFRLIMLEDQRIALEIEHRDGRRAWRIIPMEDKAVLIRQPNP